MKSNQRNAILYGVSALCSVLVFAFFALPAYSESLLGLTVSTSGYENLQFVFQNMDLASVMNKYFAIVGLVLLIIAGLTFVGSVFLLLCELDVIKNETVKAFATWATRYLSRLLVSFAFLHLVFNIMAAKGFGSTTTSGSSTPQVTTTPGWAMIIIVIVLALIPCAVTAYTQFKAKNSQAKTQEKPQEENK